MKAILVFDVHEFTYETIDDYFSGDITLHLGNDGFIEFKDVVLKPIPYHLPTPYLFRQMQIADGLQNEDGSVPVYSEDYMNGWNDCIDEILGETGGEQNEDRGV